jgi:hypothetical protein
MQQQGFHRRWRVEREADRVQFFLGWRELGLEAVQASIGASECFCASQEPDRPDRIKVAVVNEFTQKHFRAGEGVHLDRQRPFVARLAGVERIPGNVGSRIPAGTFKGLQEINAEYVGAKREVITIVPRKGAEQRISWCQPDAGVLPTSARQLARQSYKS